jgi:RNA polymerase sigma factor (sigma-70 family)
MRDRAAAEDALHDAFAEGLRRPPLQSDNVAGWLFRVALRKAHRRRWTFFSLSAVQPDPHDDVARILDRLEAGRLLALLSERQRAIVVAHYYLGFTHAETAELFRVRPGTVSATLAKALASMRKEADLV